MNKSSTGDAPMFKNLNLEEFLERNRIDQEVWNRAKIDWPTLHAIAADHEANSIKLEDWAEVIAKTIQKFNKVHSVRWRVKNAEHLIAKIIRKRSDENLKYADIALENYFEIVTDLVGVRALHLFKVDCFDIDKSLKETWTEIEPAVAYIRSGDSNEMKEQFQNQGFDVKEHNAGYRSIHYVVESIPHKRKTITEIQVRTIFEEGWSEIDHTIRYPNFSDNEQIGYFLAIFNRMAGSADDMGGFVLGLVETLNQLQNEIALIKREKETTFQEMEEALKQLESVKKQDDASKESIAILKTEISKLKLKEARNNPFFNLTDINGEMWHKNFRDLEKAKSLANVLGGLGAITQNGLLGNTILGNNEALQAQKNLLSINALANALKNP
jgi:putative GTP pyrophosphokinase